MRFLVNRSPLPPRLPPGAGHRPVRRVATALPAVLLLAGLSACGGEGDGAAQRPGSAGQLTGRPAGADDAAPGPATAGRPVTPARDATTGSAPTVVATLATGLRSPWGLAFLPGGEALVSERDTARILRVGPGGEVREVGRVPGVRPGGEGGLLGIAVAPTFAQDRYIYAYFTGSADNRLVRMRLDQPGGDGDGSLGEPEVLLAGIAKAFIHNGGRIAFGPDGMLYVATGDANTPARAQDRGSPNGKILRLTPEGRPAPGNPTDGSPVWSLGHRNVQGLAWDRRGRLWASEFGQNTYDELNRIEPGGNYGWPEVEGKAPEGGRGAERFLDPEVTWSPAQASPSGVAVLGEAVYLAGLRGRRLWEVPIVAGGTSAPRSLLDDEHGRLRTLEVAPDGSMWLVTSNTDGRGSPKEGDDRILRLNAR